MWNYLREFYGGKEVPTLETELYGGVKYIWEKWLQFYSQQESTKAGDPNLDLPVEANNLLQVLFSDNGLAKTAACPQKAIGLLGKFFVPATIPAMLFPNRKFLISMVKANGFKIRYRFDLRQIQKINHILGKEAGDYSIALAVFKFEKIVSNLALKYPNLHITYGRFGGDEFDVLIGGGSETERDLFIDYLEGELAEMFVNLPYLGSFNPESESLKPWSFKRPTGPDLCSLPDSSFDVPEPLPSGLRNLFYSTVQKGREFLNLINKDELGDNVAAAKSLIESQFYDDLLQTHVLPRGQLLTALSMNLVKNNVDYLAIPCKLGNTASFECGDQMIKDVYDEIMGRLIIELEDQGYTKESALEDIQNTLIVSRFGGDLVFAIKSDADPTNKFRSTLTKVIYETKSYESIFVPQGANNLPEFLSKYDSDKSNSGFTKLIIDHISSVDNVEEFSRVLNIFLHNYISSGWIKPNGSGCFSWENLSKTLVYHLIHSRGQRNAMVLIEHLKKQDTERYKNLIKVLERHLNYLEIESQD
jgi:hypothetical protein